MALARTAELHFNVTCLARRQPLQKAMPDSSPASRAPCRRLALLTAAATRRSSGRGGVPLPYASLILLLAVVGVQLPAFTSAQSPPSLVPVSATPLVAYSTRVIIPGYTGPVVQVRQVTTNAVSDFYSTFFAGKYGLATLGGVNVTSFLNASTGTVTIWCARGVADDVMPSKAPCAVRSICSTSDLSFPL